jgi:hypothetical protein
MHLGRTTKRVSSEQWDSDHDEGILAFSASQSHQYCSKKIKSESAAPQANNNKKAEWYHFKVLIVSYHSVVPTLSINPLLSTPSKTSVTLRGEESKRARKIFISTPSYLRHPTNHPVFVPKQNLLVPISQPFHHLVPVDVAHVHDICATWIAGCETRAAATVGHLPHLRLGVV